MTTVPKNQIKPWGTRGELGRSRSGGPSGWKEALGTVVVAQLQDRHGAPSLAPAPRTS